MAATSVVDALRSPRLHASRRASSRSPRRRPATSRPIAARAPAARAAPSIAARVRRRRLHDAVERRQRRRSAANGNCSVTKARKRSRTRQMLSHLVRQVRRSQSRIRDLRNPSNPSNPSNDGSQSATALSPGRIGRVRGSRPRRARLPTYARMPQKIDELDDVERARQRQHLPEQPQHRLRDADGPDRSVEVPALGALAVGRSPDARQPAHRAEHPARPGDRQVPAS